MRNDPPVKATSSKSNLQTHLSESDSRINQKVILFKLKKSNKPIKSMSEILIRHRKWMGHKEEVLQTVFARQMDEWQSTIGGFFWLHIPNGGRRTIGTGKKLKAQGVKPGVSDNCIVLPDQKVIWIELKASWGSSSKEQKAFSNSISALGHKSYIVKGSLPQDIIQQTAAILRENGVGV